jgi:galactosamine-6-phosphate isomerase
VSGGLRIVVCADHEALSRLAADTIAAELRRNPGLLLCAAGASTLRRAYDLLTRRRHDEPALFERLRVLKPSEWEGLAMDDPGSSEALLRERLLEPLGVTGDRYVGFRGDAINPEAECAHIAKVVEEQGPVDLCVLELGASGQLGFNEPAPELLPRAHVAALSRAALDHPMVRRARARVRHGLTLGMAEILGARKVLLLASGADLAAPLQRLREPRVATSFPASLLWLHGDATCLCDREASSEPDPEVA